MKLRIIKLGLIHLDACLEIDRKSFKGLWTKSQWERELSDPKRISLGAIDLDTKKLLSLCSAWLVLDEIQLTSIAVHPKHFRKGLGKFILSNLIKHPMCVKSNQIYLEVKETNEPAKALYKSMGFIKKGHRSNFYKDGSNALIYIKKINQKPQKRNLSTVYRKEK
tara:strand:- start:195 stop:689 length:495 start_codon:yes stop_codon:yes gene_type:complete